MNKTLFAALLFSSITVYSQFHPDSVVTDSLYLYGYNDLFNGAAVDEEMQPEQQDVSSLLLSSRDVFNQFSAMQFSAGRYRIRGLPAKNIQVSLNGVPVNNPETGTAGWSSWGGLNDVTVFAENRLGNTASRYGFSGPGGYVNLDTKASSFKKSQRLSLSNGNRTYRERVLLSRHTGMTPRGWAFSTAGSLRNGKNIYSSGTFFSAQSIYFSLERKLGRHVIGACAFFAPSRQGRTSPVTLETYTLTGDHYYNKNTGEQMAELRNSSVAGTARPMLILSDVYENDRTGKLSTSLFYTAGKNRISGISYHNAPNPDPTYYRYLPGYYLMNGDTLTAQSLVEKWQNDPGTRQVDFDRMILMNKANLYSDPHLSGQGLNQTETRARYIIEDRVEQLSYLGLNCMFNKRIDRLFYSAGIDASRYSNRKYKELNDLLGASFWIDVDQFAEDLGVEESIIQNDLDNPNKKIKTGDRFGYDYSIEIRKAGGWIQLERTGSRLDCYAALQAGYFNTWREGYLANGKFPFGSKGSSARTGFLNAGVKAGFTLKITGRQFIAFNAQASQRNPEPAGLFVSPRVRNDLIPDPRPEKLRSLDLSYHAKYPSLKTRVSFYQTKVKDQNWLRTYWHETYHTMVNLLMTGVDQSYQGVEVGIEKILRTAHVLQCALGYGEFIYSGNAHLQAWQDNSSTALFSERVSYLKNYRIGGSPQAVAGCGYRYNSKKYWYAGLAFSYLDGRYIEPNPDRRTAEALEKFNADEKKLADKISSQERLPAFCLLNASAGKSWRLKHKYAVNLSLSINNLLNNQDVIAGGFESLRWDQSNVEKFPSKYSYMHGISYMVNLSCAY